MNNEWIDDATAQLLAEMDRHGLDPGTIVWDGRKHRFRGAGEKRGSNAWYFAYPDRRGAYFGDFSTGIKVHWKFHRDTPFTAVERARFAKDKAVWDRERKEMRRLALANVRKVWKAAKRLDRVKFHRHHFHYNIEELPPDLRISTATVITNPDLTNSEEEIPAGLLLVPMYRRGRRVNLQRIYPNGRKRFFSGAELAGAWFFIGVSKETDWSLCYVCEGWATGCTIHKATNRPVVAFTASNLRAVAQAVQRRFDPGQMVIAGDNDRWSRIVQGEDGEDIINVGVHYAREAAEATGSVWAVPDFKDLAGEPTATLTTCAGARMTRRYGIGSIQRTPKQRPPNSPLTSQQWIQV